MSLKLYNKWRKLGIDSEREFKKFLKVDLIKHCKKNHLRTDGTCSVLRERLVHLVNNKVVGSDKVKVDPVARLLHTQEPLFHHQLLTSDHHPQVSIIVLDNVNYVFLVNRIIGVETQDGSITPLSLYDIDVCKKYFFNYDLSDYIQINHIINECN